MGAEKHQGGGQNQTKPPPSGTAPLFKSGPAPAGLPACIGRLLTIAHAVPWGADLRETLERLLDVLVELEPRAAVGIWLGKTAQNRELVCVVSSTSTEHSTAPGLTDGRLFPQLSEEQVIPLGGQLDGTLHFGAASFEAGPLSAGGPTADLDTLLEAIAGVVTMVVRTLTAETSLATSVASQQQLQKLATIGRSTAGIVHELNNPLTAIVAYSDLLTKQLSENEQQTTNVDRLRRISEAATRAQLFCRELTDYSRPSSRLQAPVDLHAILDRALSFCMHDLRDAEITVERCYGDLPMVLGLDTQLIQLFVNLITNAGDAMGKRGGTLEIETEVAGDQVVIAVADQGPGIKHRDLPHLFDSYFTTKPKGRGVGLGLDIAKQIVTDHGGAIRAEMREPSGAVFYVELPVEVDD